MKKHLGLIVLAGSIAFASLAAAQIPVPPAPPAPVAAPEAVPPPPPALPAPLVAPAAAPLPAPVAAPALPAAPAPMAAAVPQPPQAPPPAKAPKPARPAEPARAAEAPPAPPAAPTQPEPPGRDRYDKDPVNVRFDVTVSSQTGAAAPIKRSATVTVSNSGALGTAGTGMLRSGNSIPVPTTTFDGKETPAARPMTSYNYRSIGLNVDVSNVAVLVSGRVQAVLNIEFSGVDDKATNTTGAPSFPTFSQRLSLFFESGKPILVAQSSDFVDNLERKQTVEVKATILR